MKVKTASLIFDDKHAKALSSQSTKNSVAAQLPNQCRTLLGVANRLFFVFITGFHITLFSF